MLHTLLFIRACVETHRYRTSASKMVVPADVSGGDDLPIVVQPNPDASTRPVRLSIPGYPGHSGLYLVPGPDGRPQLLGPMGASLQIVMPSQEHQTGAVEAGSGQIYELNPGAGLSEMDAR